MSSDMTWWVEAPVSTATFAATGDPTYVADQELSVSPRCIFSSSCVGELRNVGSLDQEKKIRDGQSFIWKFWWNCQGSIVSIASNSSPGLRDWQTLSMLHVEKCSVQVLLRLAVPSDQAAARPFFELLFFNFDSWSLVRLQAEQLAIGLYETHFGESLDTNSMSAWRWNCDWSYLFIFVISNHSDFLSIIDIKFLSLTIQSSDWQV